MTCNKRDLADHTPELNWVWFHVKERLAGQYYVIAGQLQVSKLFTMVVVGGCFWATGNPLATPLFIHINKMYYRLVYSLSSIWSPPLKFAAMRLSPMVDYSCKYTY